jgi:hypothetical protein
LAINQTGDNSIASQVDCIPYGVGISGTKADDLVGVIKINSQVYFVWRRTDENLDNIMKSVGTKPDAVTFHSRREDGQDEYYGLYKYQDNYSIYCEYCAEWFDADYADQFESAGGRKITGFGRPLTWVNGDGNNMVNTGTLCEATQDCLDSIIDGGHTISGDAQTTLDTPVYVMVSKERAFDISKLWNLDYDAVGGDLVDTLLGQFVYCYGRYARNIQQATYYPPPPDDAALAKWRNRY